MYYLLDTLNIFVFILWYGSECYRLCVFRFIFCWYVRYYVRYYVVELKGRDRVSVFFVSYPVTILSMCMYGNICIVILSCILVIIKSNDPEFLHFL